jgi:hypothetical protein
MYNGVGYIIPIVVFSLLYILCLDVQWSGIYHPYCRLLSALQSGQVLRDRDNLHPGRGKYIFTVMKLRLLAN